MNFPEAWAIIRSVPLDQHNPKCSTAQTNGAILCDCEVLTQHPRYIEDYGQSPEVPT